MTDASQTPSVWTVDVLTLFPDMFPGPLAHSLAGRALEDGIWRLNAVDIRGFARDKHRVVDDAPFGGGPGMAGAVRLAAEAALRTGAGLVYVATHPDNVAAVLAGRPEIICHGVRSERELDDLIVLADAVAMGPGLGLGEWGRPLWRRVLDTQLPLVVDADGLNMLAAEPRRRADWILTPHPAEAARLLGLPSARDVQADRLAAVRELAQRYGAAVVLKGAHTLVARPGDGATAVCDRGNPGMATAGMGDVLTGVIGALLVQTRDVATSVRAGVLLHALAGDSAALAGERGMVASDLLPQLRQWANRT